MGYYYACCKKTDVDKDREEIFSGAAEEESNPVIESYCKRNTKIKENVEKNISGLEENKENLDGNVVNEGGKELKTNNDYKNELNSHYLSIKDIHSQLKNKENNESISIMKCDNVNEEAERNKAINLIGKLKALSGIQESNSFNPDGWMEYYPLDEAFFNYDYGVTKKDQFIVENENNMEECSVYEGETNLSGLKHGHGALYSQNRIEKGTYRDNKLTGWCQIVQNNGEFFEGKVIEGIPNGFGIYKNSKGQVYSGEFLNGKRSGKGKFVTSKFEYEGDFCNGKLDGNGTIQFSDGHLYTGEFRNNEINGFGEFRWKNGDYYKGQMANGKMEGQGRYEYSDGQIYEGEYRSGIKEGRGKLSYPGGKSYEGQFKNGLPDGEGIFTNGNESVKVLFEKGEFKKKLDENNN